MSIFPISNLEINLLYRLARAMDIILKDVEENLKMEGSHFHRERKKAFNKFMASVKEARRQYDILDDDIADIYQDQTFDFVQEEAFRLARCLLRFADCHMVDFDFDKKLEKYLKSKPNGGIFVRKAHPGTGIPDFDYLDRHISLKL